jgi:hypothetical protein
MRTVPDKIALSDSQDKKIHSNGTKKRHASRWRFDVFLKEEFNLRAEKTELSSLNRMMR